MSEDLSGSMATRRMATVEWTSSTKGGHHATEHNVADFTYGERSDVAENSIFFFVRI